MKQIVAGLDGAVFEGEKQPRLLQQSLTWNGLPLIFKLRKGKMLADDKAVFYARGR